MIQNNFRILYLVVANQLNFEKKIFYKPFPSLKLIRFRDDIQGVKYFLKNKIFLGYFKIHMYVYQNKILYKSIIQLSKSSYKILKKLDTPFYNICKVGGGENTP